MQQLQEDGWCDFIFKIMIFSIENEDSSVKKRVYCFRFDGQTLAIFHDFVMYSPRTNRSVLYKNDGSSIENDDSSVEKRFYVTGTAVSAW